MAINHSYARLALCPAYASRGYACRFSIAIGCVLTTVGLGLAKVCARRSFGCRADDVRGSLHEEYIGGLRGTRLGVFHGPYFGGLHGTHLWFLGRDHPHPGFFTVRIVVVMSTSLARCITAVDRWVELFKLTTGFGG